jgi:hypothetical protein
MRTPFGLLGAQIDGYILLIVILGTLVLWLSGRLISEIYLVRKSQSDPYLAHSTQAKAVPYAIYVLLQFSACAFLCKDLLVWLWIYEIQESFGAWQILYGLLSSINLSVIALPFVFENSFRKQYGHLLTQCACLALFMLWLGNVMITYAVWGGLCGFCYFG